MTTNRFEANKSAGGAAFRARVSIEVVELAFISKMQLNARREQEDGAASVREGEAASTGIYAAPGIRETNPRWPKFGCQKRFEERINEV